METSLQISRCIRDYSGETPTTGNLFLGVGLRCNGCLWRVQPAPHPQKKNIHKHTQTHEHTQSPTPRNTFNFGLKDGSLLTEGNTGGGEGGGKRARRCRTSGGRGVGDAPAAPCGVESHREVSGHNIPGGRRWLSDSDRITRLAMRGGGGGPLPVDGGGMGAGGGGSGYPVWEF